jgi:beta-lactam-binding protein with PASTA domain
MGNYLGPNKDRAVADFGTRARWYDSNLQSSDPSKLPGCIVYQSPSPGSAIGSSDSPSFVVSEKVEVPSIEGQSVAEAERTLGTHCLTLWIVPSCADASAGAAPTADQSDKIIVTQCTAAGEFVPSGDHVGVVIGGDPPKESGALAAVLATAVLVLAVAAVVLYVRLSSTRDELAILKSPKSR